ncbi:MULTISPECIES: YhfG family protein [Winslowiella]|uniref:YhfG family protein n=1 Tax=Winslowiella TaxID=2997349 RepID=UPI0028BDF6CE|nr:YhfG family protein [Winslowiella toletana]WNN44665.1 YhfG family protein [Winslowiella toletana]
MSKKLTDKQKAALWLEHHNANFQASSRLEGYQIERVELSAQQVAERLNALRRHYER